jgi:hypothetical protein
VRAVAFCLCIALLGTTHAQARRERIFCGKNALEVIAIADVVRPSDNNTQSIQADAHALRPLLESRSFRGSLNAADNARWQRIRAFVKNKCHGREIGPNLPGS